MDSFGVQYNNKPGKWSVVSIKMCYVYGYKKFDLDRRDDILQGQIILKKIMDIVITHCAHYFFLKRKKNVKNDFFILCVVRITVGVFH